MFCSEKDRPTLRDGSPLRSHNSSLKLRPVTTRSRKVRHRQQITSIMLHTSSPSHPPLVSGIRHR